MVESMSIVKKANAARTMLLKYIDKEIKGKINRPFQKRNSVNTSNEFTVNFKEHLFFSKDDENKIYEADRVCVHSSEKNVNISSEKIDKTKTFLKYLALKSSKVREREGYQYLLSYIYSLKLNKNCIGKIKDTLILLEKHKLKILLSSLKEEKKNRNF